MKLRSLSSRRAAAMISSRGTNVGLSGYFICFLACHGDYLRFIRVIPDSEKL